jgi:hypothetical protein
LFGLYYSYIFFNCNTVTHKGGNYEEKKMLSNVYNPRFFAIINEGLISQATNKVPCLTHHGTTAVSRYGLPPESLLLQ